MYLNFTVAKGTRVGLVKYNNTAYNLTTGLRKINNQEDRDYLMNLVPKRERKGGSAIGLGLRLATKVRAERCIQMYVLTVAPIFTFFYLPCIRTVQKPAHTAIKIGFRLHNPIHFYSVNFMADVGRGRS